jgi:hypothetical protein
MGLTESALEEYMACGHIRYAAINYNILHRARHLCISLGHLPSDDGPALTRPHGFN